ncbi:MAG: hypothetical protein GF392_03190 [Candidatus Omnitrophica bacterium]|nr:hypothetical protein [Candidatus Omnitrophota bacterium]
MRHIVSFQEAQDRGVLYITLIGRLRPALDDLLHPALDQLMVTEAVFGHVPRSQHIKIYYGLLFGAGGRVGVLEHPVGKRRIRVQPLYYLRRIGLSRGGLRLVQQRLSFRGLVGYYHAYSGFPAEALLRHQILHIRGVYPYLTGLPAAVRHYTPGYYRPRRMKFDT